MPSLTAALSYLGTMLANTLSFIFIGSSENSTVQAAHGLAYSIGNVLFLITSIGLVNGMDTLCPLAMGLSRPEYTLAHMFQAICIIVCLIPILAPILICSKPLLLLFVPNEITADLVAQYLIYSIPSFLFMGLFETARKFLIIHQHATSQTAISLSTLGIQAVFLYIYINVLNLHIIGAALSRSCTWFVASLVIYAYIIYYRDQFGWKIYMNTKLDDVCIIDPDVTMPKISLGSSPSNINTSEQFSKSYKETSKEFLTTNDSEQTQQEYIPLDKSIAVPITTEPKLQVHQSSPTINTPLSPTPRLDHLQQTSIELSQHSPNSPTDFNTLTPKKHMKKKKNILVLHKHWWQGLPLYLKVAIPSTLLCAVEWLAFEAQIIGAAPLGDAQVAAFSSVNSIAANVFIIHLSIGLITNREIGKSIGSKRPEDASQYAKSGLLLGTITSTCFCVSVFLARKPLANIYTKTNEIEVILVKFLIWTAIITIIDSLHIIFSSILKAVNLQWYGCLFDFTALLITMEVLGFCLAYLTTLKAEGFLIGTFVGLLLSCTLYATFVFAVLSWKKQCEILTGEE